MFERKRFGHRIGANEREVRDSGFNDALAIGTIGFMLDPVFHGIGRWLLVDVEALRPLWTTWDNVPGMALTNFNNTVVLGSVVAWLVLFIPLYFASRLGVTRYRASIGERVRNSRYYKLLEASQIYNVYRWFRP